MFEKIINDHKSFTMLRKKIRVTKRVSIALNLDREKPTVKIYDGISAIEMSIDDFKQLQGYTPNSSSD